MACPACGAPNAASRLLCARCKVDLHGDPDALPELHDIAEQDTQPDTEGPSRLLILATVIAILAGVGVMVAILSAQGFGPFAQDVPDVLSDAEAAEVVAVRASSERPADGERDFMPANILDGATSTAWVADDPAPGWIELELEEVTDVVGLVIWNGYQTNDRFGRYDRFSTLVIETDDRRFTVDLLDTRGPLAVDLPETVPASRIRLIAEEVFSGDEVDGPALSLVEVRTQP